MGWTTNEMRIAMNTAKTARKAVEIIKNFILDNSSTVCAKNFINALSIKKNVIVVEENCSVDCKEHFTLIPELCKAIAEADPSASFEGTACATSSYNEETDHSFSYKNNTLNITSKLFPEGDSYLCPEEDCEAFICHYEDFSEDGIFVCEECGEEYTFDQLKGTLPEISEKTFTF